jgi:murein DD-endopeptidase MepM/ murein hydrolase activator NlpD
VLDGETLWDIAKLHKVSVEDIKQVNGFTEHSVIQAGQVIKVPVAATEVAVALTSDKPASVNNELAATQPAPAAEPTLAATPEASSSLTLGAIGEAAAERDAQVARVDSSTATQDMTDLSTSSLDLSPAAESAVPSQLAATPTPEPTAANAEAPQLAIGRVTTPTVPTATVRHRVRAGDTIWSIARQYGIAPSELVAANRIDNPNRIFVGTTLVVPNAGATSTEAPIGRSQPQPLEFAALEPFRLPSESAQSTPLESDASPTAPEAAVAPQEQEAEELELSQSAPEAVSATEADPYVANLLARVEAVQEEADASVNSTASSTQTPETQTPATVARSEQQEESLQLAVGNAEVDRAVGVDAVPVNPEFNPNQEGNGVELPSTLGEQELLAAASLGSEVYAPMVENPAGRVVSPDMPILPDSSEYLPDAPARFSGYMWPAQGVFTSGYGWRWGRMHRGVDIAGPVGTPIVAAAPGVVVRSGWNSGGYGNLVDIRHPDGSLTRYAHNSRLLVEAGQQVRGGQQIAEMGSTGYSTGPHLHFEIHLPDQGTVDPMAYLPGR